MIPTITRTYRLPEPSEVKVSYTEGERGFLIQGGVGNHRYSTWIGVDDIPALADIMKAIRMVKAKELTEGIATDDE